MHAASSSLPPTRRNPRRGRNFPHGENRLRRPTMSTCCDALLCMLMLMLVRVLVPRGASEVEAGSAFDWTRLLLVWPVSLQSATRCAPHSDAHRVALSVKAGERHHLPYSLILNLTPIASSSFLLHRSIASSCPLQRGPPRPHNGLAAAPNPTIRGKMPWRSGRSGRGIEV